MVIRMTCPWCKDGVCRNAGDESDCDFKTLEKDPDAIKKRMDEENDKIIKLMKLDYSDKEMYLQAKAKIVDVTGGVAVMKSVLEGEFHANYKFSRQGEMTKALLDFILKGKRLDRAKR